jgi:hypothetical protein
VGKRVAVQSIPRYTQFWEEERLASKKVKGGKGFTAIHEQLGEENI